ncbi:MAG: T9SS type A sorting domain-containing protein [Flavobacteriales bacterium]|jgi:hypothetical protein|nr:T9SS type A sorting domain-containing protein [Flavobacteriales bacterium]MBK6549971.1 T9SS type A sorting domain-containing protein [Flavobacteriales bacterium]MBK6881865.1 T9SS type A sorting domain-containing protein [Flavobacteriales bacterium]MBK7102481.1 T9SS type A sorting domain-containing protein [Flavobacteriales bacterium]MBK7113216.1 T9SS type A sorting domain-containing protein [Flavobacteriales bacterium]
MKKTVLFVTMLLAVSAQGQLVDSGFEDWTAGSPDGWNGARTNMTIPAEQVSDDVHGGASAVRLNRTESGHQRFTTQALSVTSGTEYEVSFWVRGSGEIRVGLYDERSTGFGYFYGSWHVATATWTQVTEVVTAVQTSSIAEFILSVHLTAPDQHIVVDDVLITEGGAIPEVSIHDIQYTTDPSGDSPYFEQLVKTVGIVTAKDQFQSNGTEQNVYYLQDASGPWNGVYVFDYLDNGNVVEIGDEVELIAVVDEYFGLTELKSIQSFSVLASGQTLPAALVVETGEVSSEALESVLIQVLDATCTEVPGGANFGKWKADDGSGFAVVGKEIYTTTPDPELGVMYNVTGVVSYGFEEFNIQPRYAADIEMITSIGELAGADVTLFPNPASTVLTLDLGALAGRTEYRLIDATGRVVLADVVTADRSTIDVSTLQSGVYVMTLNNGASSWSDRVTVQH